MITTLTSILNEGESLRLSLEATGEGQYAITIIPILTQNGEAAVGDGDTTEADSLRAALTVPLRLTGSAKWLEENLIPTITQYAERRTTLASEISALDALKEATKEARAKSLESGKDSDSGTQKKEQANVNDEKEAAPPPPPPPPADPASNPDSLF